MNKLLGIDYGDKRVGLALAESGPPAGGLALPYKVIKNNNKLLDELNKIINEEAIEVVVVGLPHSLSGQPNQRLAKTEAFVDFLRSNLQILIVTADEQMTSKLFTKQGIKKDIDKHSAAAILDTYLARENDS